MISQASECRHQAGSCAQGAVRRNIPDCSGIVSWSSVMRAGGLGEIRFLTLNKYIFSWLSGYHNDSWLGATIRQYSAFHAGGKREDHRHPKTQFRQVRRANIYPDGLSGAL